MFGGLSEGRSKRLVSVLRPTLKVLTEASPGPTERAPSAPVPSIVDENWAGVDMMYHLDGRRRHQLLVYFGKP